MKQEHSHIHHHQFPGNRHTKPYNVSLALSATLHCTLGCGFGEIAGMVIGAGLHWTNTQQMILAIVLGFIAGFALGMRPLLKAGFSFKRAFKQVLIAEGLSIVVMETAEVLAQIYTPGVLHASLADGIFWLGMLLSLLAGFAAAFPINYYMIKRGVRHQH